MKDSRREKWSKTEKQKWVLKKGSRSETEKKAYTGKSANWKASCSYSDLPSSSSFMVGLGSSKSTKFGCGRNVKEAVILETVENSRTVACNPMNDVVEDVYICSSKDKDELILWIGKGVRMSLRTEAATALLEELRLYRGIDNSRNSKDEASAYATEVAGTESLFAASSSRSEQLGEGDDWECSGYCRTTEGTRRYFPISTSEEEVEAGSVLESLFLPLPVWECNEEPRVDIPLAAVRAARVEDRSLIPFMAESHGDRNVRSVE